MAVPPIAISGHGMAITPAIEQYINEKFKKHEGLLSASTSITVECVEEKASRGVDHDFRVEVSVSLPNSLVRIEKSGADIYAVVDEVSDVVVRKLKKYKEMKLRWEEKPTLMEENVVDEKESHDDEDRNVDYLRYAPKIVERLKLENCTPMSEGEAIEQMELADLNCYLFKMKETGTFAMVYKRKRGGYGIVEPEV